jgi:diguanylate cyclase (GGDEF)-like protein
MKINAKLITSFGTVLVTTLVVFGRISYSTFTEHAHKTSDKIIALQGSEVIYQATKTLNEEMGEIGQQLFFYMQSNACSLNSEGETKQLFETFINKNPLFRSITLSFYREKVLPPEFQSWRDEEIVKKGDQFKPFLHRQAEDLFLLWPTQTPQGPAFLLINLDLSQLALRLSSYLSNSGYLNISGAAIMLTDNHGQFLLNPIQQDVTRPLGQNILSMIDVKAPTEHVEDKGEVYAYRPPDKLFGADLTLVVPKEFNQENLIQLKNRIIAAMLIVGWVSVWIMLIIAYKISSPLRKLSKITKDIIEFNYSTEMEIPPSHDEIGELAENFENMRQKIKTLVTEDPLTQVYNRRFVMHIFDLAVMKANRDKSPLCCIMMDIDHFKKVNDSYGHQGGDIVLVAVGKVLKEISRDYDTPARYGGEEFLCLLPETTLTDATAIAERIRGTVKQLSIPFENKELCCTMSLGVSKFMPEMADTTDKIIRDADKALYQAKENGRDQVVVCQHVAIEKSVPPAVQNS